MPRQSKGASPRRNGILATPQKLVDAVTRFAMGAVATDKAWVQAAALSQDPELARVIREDTAHFKRVQLRLKPLPPWGKGYGVTAEVNLSDLGRSYPIKKMEQHNPTLEINLITQAAAYFKMTAAAFNGWTGINERYLRVNRIGLNIPLLVALTPEGDSLRAYRKIKSTIRQAVAHELRHFVQAALNDAKGAPRRGMTLAQLNELETIGLEKYGKGGQFRSVESGKPTYTEYITSLVEFFPWIADWFEYTRESVESWDRPMQMGDFSKAISKEYTRTDDVNARAFRVLRNAIKEHDPVRYRRLQVEQAVYMNDYNDAFAARKRAKEFPRHLTPQRVISEVLLDLDVVDSELAAYLRLRRDDFIEYAKRTLP